MAEKLCELKQKGGSNSGSDFTVLLSVSGAHGVSGAIMRAILFSDSENASYINKLAVNASVTLTGNDFSGTVSNNSNTASNITVKKAGIYKINNDGTESTQTLSANDTVSIPAFVGFAKYWYMVKIG